MKFPVVLGLGSNLGDSLRLLDKAVEEIRHLMPDARQSSVYVSDALVPAGAPDNWNRTFYNLAVAGHVSLRPEELLAALKQIESQLGRIRRERWAPREIDIDILT